MTDARGLWLARLGRRHEALCGLVSGRLMRLRASWWGVQLGRGCVFYGRTRLRRSAGSSITIGDECRFRSAVGSNWAGIDRPCMLSTLREGASLKVGSTCGFSGTVIAAAESIVIGDRVMCGANTTITDTDWHSVNLADRYTSGTAATAPVSIQDDVWIGLGAIVLKGVTIGRGTVVAAGSVVTKSLPEMVIAAGNPAQIIGRL